LRLWRAAGWTSEALIPENGITPSVADWLVSLRGQQGIGAYRVNGQKPFDASAASPR
jgi:hypothetical protein